MLRHVWRHLRRPSVNSFDIFDTLISRRVADPKAVFTIIGERAGLPDYAAQRQASEAVLWDGKTEYDIDDIYTELATRMGLAAPVAARLKSLELAVELEQVIPIVENLSLVRRGDILVSDMYLDKDFIGAMLAKAGLGTTVDLYVSAQGKRRGTIWPGLKKRYRIRKHIGDNWHADRASPRSAWIRCRMTQAAAWTEPEKIILDLGLPELAATCREARLASWNDDRLLRRLQLVQADCNLPLLALASVDLLRAAQDAGASHILFSSRDCNLWQEIFAKIVALAGTPAVTQEYFYTSRAARLCGSADYRRYAAERIGPASIVADIAGTGQSLASLCRTIGAAHWHAYYIHRMKPRTADDESHDRFAVSHRDGAFRNWVFEACNYADHPSIRDIAFRGDRPVPLYGDVRPPADVAAAIAAQQAVFRRGVAALGGAAVAEMRRLSPDDLRHAIRQVYAQLSEQEAPRIAFKIFHEKEDRKATPPGCSGPADLRRPAAYRA